MRLSEEKKAHILASLKQDYIPFSDVFHEICADIVADMMMSGSLQTEMGKSDRIQLHHLELEYFSLIPERYMDVIPVVEQVLNLQEKYHKLRLGE